jgi:hypothetical protein
LAHDCGKGAFGSNRVSARELRFCLRGSAARIFAEFAAIGLQMTSFLQSILNGRNRTLD